jgi:hypothetical protein
MASYAYTFTSGDTVTPTKLNNARTVSEIVNADIKSDAAIAGTKVAPNFGSQALSTTGSASVGSLTVSGNTTLGDAAADTITLTGTVQNGVVISGSSSGDALRITQTGSGNALTIEDSANPDATPFVVTNIGDVGVNVSAPANKLHVAKPTAGVADTQLELEGGFGGYGAGVNFSSRTSSGGTLVAMAKITADGEDSWNATASTQDAGLRFFTAADGSLAERVRINSFGNLGIGLTAPTERLDVNGTVKATAFSGPLTGNVTGNASGSAATLATGRTIALTGDVTGTTGSFNGSANVSASTTIANNAVETAKIADATSTTTGVTNSKLRHSAALSVIGRTSNTDGAPADIAAANDGEVFRRSGTAVGFGTVATAGIANAAVTPTKLSQPLTLATAQATTSGTSIDFTGIPSWVKRITVMFSGVSTNGTSQWLVQLGDSEGVENTDYVSSVSTGTTVANSTSGFVVLRGVAAATTNHGLVTICLVSSANNTWAASGVLGWSNDSQTAVSGGSKSLSATLDRVRLTTVNGTDTFDAGSVNIMYEG